MCAHLTPVWAGAVCTERGILVFEFAAALSLIFEWVVRLSMRSNRTGAFRFVLWIKINYERKIVRFDGETSAERGAGQGWHLNWRCAGGFSFDVIERAFLLTYGEINHENEIIRYSTLEPGHARGCTFYSSSKFLWQTIISSSQSQSTRVLCVYTHIS